ncbi:MAG: transposase [Deltaproteobacteria bacterium]|nr:transposase [Deltaproteobacteria bacterium]
MRSRYKIAELESPHFITCTIVGWLPVFTRQRYLDIITASLTFCRQQKGLRLHAYVILDNHLHLVVSSDNLSQVIRDFKRHTAKEIQAVARQDDKLWLLKQFEFFKGGHKGESQHQVWQEGFHPQAITTEDMLRQKLDYIHYNPVRSGLVDRPEDWRHSSARNYLDQTGVLEIDLVEL